MIVSQHFDSMPYNDSYISKSLKKLNAGRIDTFLISYYSGLYKMRRAKVEKEFRLAGCASSSKIYMAFSPTQHNQQTVKTMVSYFDKQMKRLKANGTITTIMDKYGLK